jgi:hypothetical protein
MTSSQGHTMAPYGKRVQVVLHSGASFIAKFRAKESGYHHFFDHNKVKSNLVNQLRILPTGVTPPTHRQEIKLAELDKVKKDFENGKLTLPELRKKLKEIYPNSKLKVTL